MPLTDYVRPPIEDRIHGVAVHDPFRWLEGRGLPETENWIRQQRRRCAQYFAECDQFEAIRARVHEYLDIEVVDQPAKVGERYFYRRRKREQEQGCIYVDSMDRANERLLVDPSVHGQFASVGIHRISNDGSLLAYELRHGGEDRRSIHVVDVKSGVTLPNLVALGHAHGFCFASDKRGFYYCQETLAGGDEHIIQYQRLSEPRESQIVFRVPRSQGSRLLLIADSIHLGALWIREHAGERVQDLWIARHDRPSNWNRIFFTRSLLFSPVLAGGHILAVSFERIPNGELVQLDEHGEELRTVIPAQRMILGHIAIAGEFAFVRYFDGDEYFVRRWNLQGEELSRIEVPPCGTVRLLPHLGGEESVFYSDESFARLPTIYEYSLGSQTSRIWYERPSCSNTASVTVQRRTYGSRDKVEIPITLVSSQPFNTTTPLPAIMTSYGGFGVPMTPQFSVLAAILIECGAIFVLPHVRGGGEFGKTWHDAARGRQKQTTFDDFLAAADWLCREGLTTPRQLGIFGGSNSGLLVGVAMTQRPDLFRAVLCISPLLDMVRYEKLNQTAKWREEYGTCDSREDFQALFAYSPYHRIQSEVDYPSVLFVSGDKDERCNPAHVRKMAARLLVGPAQSNPVLVDYSDERGHSPALPLQVRIDALARRVVFFVRELGLPFDKGGCREASSV